MCVPEKVHSETVQSEQLYPAASWPISSEPVIANQFGTRHTELLVSADDLMQHLPTLIDHGDAPVAEASNIPIYLISKEAAKSVKTEKEKQTLSEMDIALKAYIESWRVMQALHAEESKIYDERVIAPCVFASPCSFGGLG